RASGHRGRRRRRGAGPRADGRVGPPRRPGRRGRGGGPAVGGPAAARRDGGGGAGLGGRALLPRGAVPGQPGAVPRGAGLVTGPASPPAAGPRRLTAPDASHHEPRGRIMRTWLGLPLLLAGALACATRADDKKADPAESGWVQLFNG